MFGSACRRLLALGIALHLGSAGSGAAGPRLHRQIIGSHSHEGIEVELALEPVDHSRDLDLRAGENVRFLFSIRDATTGLPVTGLYPAAWMQSRPDEGAGPKGARRSCEEMVEAFLGGGLFSQADLDLNVYHVLALNQDHTISVVDPLFGFGGSKLLSMISLPGRGHDWVRMRQAPKLFVSLPESNQIALINAASWEVASLMSQVKQPTRLFLQPDESFLWATVPGGVAVFGTDPFVLQHLLPTGKGAHAIAFGSNNRYAFVTNRDAGTLAVIDLGTFKILQTLPTGAQPSSLAYDSRSDAVYVLHEKSGEIVCIDGISHEVYKTIRAEPGSARIRFAPQGRWGFLINSDTNRLSIIDSALDRIVQTALVEKGPAEIAFSDSFAYIRHRDSATLSMVPLDSGDLGRPGRRIPAIETPGGDTPYGHLPNPTPAGTIVQAPGASAVLIANPRDKAIYFYKEGMAAPMGQFNNYGREPRAVLVVDRSLQERSVPGVYETVGKLQKSGPNEVIFFTDSPRMTMCFEIPVKPPEAAEDAGARTRFSIQALDKEWPSLSSGKPAKLQFKVTDATTGSPPGRIEPLRAFVFATPGSWRKRVETPVRLDGSATVEFVPPHPGIFQIKFESPSGVSLQQAKRFVLQVLPE